MDDAERDRLVAWLIAEFEVQNGIDVTNDEMAITRLREAVSRIGRVTDTHEVSLPFLAADATGPKHLHVVLAKRRIDDILAGREGPPHVDRTPRSVPPPPPEEVRTSNPPERSTMTKWLLIALIVAIAGAVASGLLYEQSSHEHHEHDDGHRQEHKR